MVAGQWKPSESSSEDETVLECISWGDREEGRASLLPVILRRIARQVQNEISINQAEDLLGGNKWLQETLTACWKRGSFEDVRRLGECYLYLPNEQRLLKEPLRDPFFNPDILQSTSPVSIPPADVEIDTLPIRGSQGIDVPGNLPPTSQHDLAVPGEPTSEMVEDKLDHDDDTTLNKQIMGHFPSTLSSTLLNGGNEEPIEAALASLLTVIAQKNNLTIRLGYAQDMLGRYEWLRGLLIEKWQEESFTEVRRLSECPRSGSVCLLRASERPDFRLEILQPTSTTVSSPSGDVVMSGPGRLSFRLLNV
jgi:hypothetical protein